MGIAMFKGTLAVMALIMSGILFTATPAKAQQCYTAEIRVFATNYCPVGWAATDGAVLGVSDNTPLFSLLGTSFGGDGRSTFAVPDLRGRVVIGSGAGTGLSNRQVGNSGGAETVTLGANQLPSHSHALSGQVTGTLSASDGVADVASPSGAHIAKSFDVSMYGSANSTTVDMAAGIVKVDLTGGSTLDAGGNSSVPVMNPYQVLTSCICVSGTFPNRN